jgi:hypothetical protein
MSGGVMPPPMCARCGKRRAEVRNKLIGGDYCKPCDRYITSSAPDLEAQYNGRVAISQKESETK